MLYTSGSDDGTNATKPDKVARFFSPETAAKEAKAVTMKDEYDILITTDVLAEGKTYNNAETSSHTTCLVTPSD